MSLHDKMQWLELIVWIIVLEFGVLVIWSAGRVISRILDRRPRESMRCRKCWYDLRGTASNECPECGADLVRLGVWPPGKPVRRHWVNVLGVWLALCVLIAVPACVWFYRNTYIKQGELCAYLADDRGERTAIHLIRSGNGIQWPLWAPRSYRLGDRIQVRLLYGDKYIDNLMVQLPRAGQSSTTSTLVSAGFGYASRISTNMVKNEWQRNWGEMPKALQSQLDALVKETNLCVDWIGQHDRFYPYRDYSGAKAELWAQLSGQFYLEVKPEIWASWYRSPAPLWTIAVPISFFVLFWLLVAWLLTRDMRKRSTQSWTPEAFPTAAGPPHPG